MNRFLKPSNRSRSAQHDVNFMILTMAFLFCSLSQTLLAQEGCYQRTHSGGVTAMNKKEYDKAIQWFEQAKGCPDKPSNNDLESLIKKCQTKKKELADNKRKAEEQRRQKAEEKRIQEEREQWEREQEEAQEAEMAKRAYMNIVGMKFFNEDVDGERISEEGEILYSTDVKFLVPVVCYNGLADEARMVTLCCKIFKPNGDLETFVDSPEGYSFFQDVIVLPDANNELRLGRWGRKEGGTFIPGTYTFEIYTVDSILVRTERIPLMEKIELPTSALITLISEDSQANIYVDDVYQGFGSQSVSLTYGNHVVECRRTHYRSAQKQINVTADSDGKTIRIDKPQPIYGSLRVDSKPQAAEVFVDGKIQGETPIELPQLLIGEHQLKLIKKGYLDVNKNITIYENSTMPIDVKMTRQKTDNRFASFFMDGVYGNIGNAEPMVGGQLAFCKRHVGFYGQFLYGIDYGSYTATGGLVFRLTKDYIDIQMNVGMGYGSLLKYSSYYEGYFHSDQLLFDVGGRLGWRTGWKWSMFDIMGGCIMSIDGHVCPYVGVGTALSLAAIITGLSIAEF